MCFSATASFTASAVLVTIGVVAERRSATPAQRLLATIPFLFGLQQFTEGLLWIGLSHPGLDFFSKPAMYIFMIIAQVVWPILIPLSLLLLEKNATRKKVLGIFLGAGIIAAAYLFYWIAFQQLTVNIECYHINYRQSLPDITMKYGGIFYLSPIIIAPFFSTIKGFRLFSIVILLSYAIAQFFYAEYLASVWCFFAAIISIIILMIIHGLNKVEAAGANR